MMQTGENSFEGPNRNPDSLGSIRLMNRARRAAVDRRRNTTTSMMRRIVAAFIFVAMLISYVVLYRSVESLHFLSRQLAVLSASRRMFVFGDEISLVSLGFVLRLL